MTKNDDRIYFKEIGRFHPQILAGHFGSELRIIGLVIGGSVRQFCVACPGELIADFERPAAYHPDLDEWTALIRATDDPVYFTAHQGNKVAHRKVQRQLSGLVQQKIWAADGFECQYCGIRMGETTLTIDHFTPMELGGSDESDNLITACRKCNRLKGAMDPIQWCLQIRLSHESIGRYLKERLI
jgi:hypothetical protein